MTSRRSLSMVDTGFWYVLLQISHSVSISFWLRRLLAWAMNALWSLTFFPVLLSTPGRMSVFVMSKEIPMIMTPVSQVPSPLVSRTKFDISSPAFSTYWSTLSWAPSPWGTEYPTYGLRDAKAQSPSLTGSPCFSTAQLNLWSVELASLTICAGESTQITPSHPSPGLLHAREPLSCLL